MRNFLVFLPLTGATLGLLKCDTEPLHFPLRDVQVLSDKPQSLMKGISAKIGTPAQSVVLLPWAELNNTWIYDSEAYCDKTIIWNDEICRVRRGNLLQEENSTTYKKYNNIVAAGGAPEETVFEGSELGIRKLISTGLGGTDTVQVGSSQPLDSFPFGIPRLSWDHGYTMLHPLGLGSNSTYLNALRDAGQLTSRVWSLFWGRMWIDDPVDGSLVLGGYDDDKVIGQNYTAPLVFDDFTSSSGCWTGMKVTISDIKLNFRDGRDVSLFPANTALPCCLVPQRQLLLEAPGAYVDKFENVTGTQAITDSYGLHWSSRIYDVEHAFDGDITFSFTSGLEVQVPNSQYLTPFVDIQRNASRTIQNNTRELLINGVADQPATLGRYFFTSAYLMVNHDAKTFTLWKANPSKTTNLVRVMDEAAAAQCDNDSVVVQPTATPSDSPAESASSANSSVSGATIGGAVAGSLVGLGVILLVVFFLLRRRRQSNKPEVPPGSQPLSYDLVGNKPPDYDPGSQHDSQGGYNHYPQELHGSRPAPSEFEGSSSFVFEMEVPERR